MVSIEECIDQAASDAMNYFSYRAENERTGAILNRCWIPTEDAHVQCVESPELNQPAEWATFHIHCAPTMSPTAIPTRNPTRIPSRFPSLSPTGNPTRIPSENPSMHPSTSPSMNPTDIPTQIPSLYPTRNPTRIPSRFPSLSPTGNPTRIPTKIPSMNPSTSPSMIPTHIPTQAPQVPSLYPTDIPSQPRNRPHCEISPRVEHCTGCFCSGNVRMLEMVSIEECIDQAASDVMNYFSYRAENARTGTILNRCWIPTEDAHVQCVESPELNQPAEWVTFHIHCVPTMSPTPMPTRNPTRIPSSFSSLSPTGNPTRPSMNPTDIPSQPRNRTDPSIAPTANPLARADLVIPDEDSTSSPTECPLHEINESVEFVAGICSDSSGNALHGWSVSMESFSDCINECADDDECKASSFGQAFNYFNDCDSYCILHRVEINRYQPPHSYKGDSWLLFEGSDNFGMDIGTFTTEEYRQTMGCKISQNEESDKDDELWILCYFGFAWGFWYLMIFLFFLIYTCDKLCDQCCSKFIPGSETSSEDVGHRSPSVAGSETPAVDVGQGRRQHTIRGLLFGDCCKNTMFVPDVGGAHEIEKNVVCKWFMGLPCMDKGKIVWQMVDVITDFLFVLRSYGRWFQDKQFVLAAVAISSLAISTICVALVIGFDIILYGKHGPSSDFKKAHRVYNIRWNFFIIVPVEDITMIVLVVHNFMTGSRTIWGIPTIVTSIISVVVVHFCGLIAEVQHHFDSKEERQNSQSHLRFLESPRNAAKRFPGSPRIAEMISLAEKTDAVEEAPRLKPPEKLEEEQTETEITDTPSIQVEATNEALGVRETPQDHAPEKSAPSSIWNANEESRKRTREMRSKTQEQRKQAKKETEVNDAVRVSMTDENDFGMEVQEGGEEYPDTEMSKLQYFSF